MADISALFERLKNNKLALPAIGIGVVVGGYFLLKNGGKSGGLSSSLDASSLAERPLDSGGGSSGGGADGGEVIPTQPGGAGFGNEIADFLNAQSSRFQEMLDSLQANALGQQGLFASGGYAEAPYSDVGYLPDLSSLYGSLSSLPQQFESAIPSFPQLQSSPLSLTKSLSQIAKTPIRLPAPQTIRIQRQPIQAALGGRVRALNPIKTGQLLGSKSFSGTTPKSSLRVTLPKPPIKAPPRAPKLPPKKTISSPKVYKK